MSCRGLRTCTFQTGHDDAILSRQILEKRKRLALAIKEPVKSHFRVATIVVTYGGGQLSAYLLERGEHSNELVSSQSSAR